jgi:hypothetical protein
VRLVTGCFGSGACVAGGYVTVDIITEVRPIEIAGDKFEGLGLSKVACRWRVVALAENLEFYRVIVRDVH